MGLEKIFGKAEKVEEERKLEVVISEESVLDDWCAYFKKGWAPLKAFKDYFVESQKYLQSYQIKPELISKFNKMANTKKAKNGELIYIDYLGVFLSALIQTSYNKGFNDFEFDKIKMDDFGAFLHGQKGKPIKINVELIKGYCALLEANNCFLRARTIAGNNTLAWAKNCVLEVQTIAGDDTLTRANSCSLIREIIVGYRTLENSLYCVEIERDY